MTGSKKHKPELLAPAGTINVFEKAIEAGADAVYIGAPSLNARALSKDFSLAEIAAMIEFAHGNNVKLYLAANSLLKEKEIQQAVETLAMLEALQADALIVQDLGLYQLCKQYFPKLRLHASTLFGAHNSMAVKQFQNMGFDRVVLARELTIKEISAIARKTKVELEVFIHGAMCFSYSGLCLFSSYLGGKSGLRGRCVQPCRRRYNWHQKGQKPGYLFSMNDLSGIDLVKKLEKAGVGSFKIEGRLRSAHYVASVVKAYRMIIDAPAGDRESQKEAKSLLSQAMGRKISKGYFTSPQAKELISPYQSGNIGMFLGKAAKGAGKGRASLVLKEPLQCGDRLRLHQEGSGERISFTLRNLIRKGRNAKHAKAGESIILEVPASVRKGDSFFKVDSRAAREAEKESSPLVTKKHSQTVKKIDSQVRKKVLAVCDNLAPSRSKKKRGFRAGKKRVKGRRDTIFPLSVLIDDLQVLKQRLPVSPEFFLVELNRKTFGDSQRMKKVVKKYQHKIAWSLPPVILENELDFYAETVRKLIKSNFRNWQIGHIGQLLFFNKRDRVNILGGYTLNVLNSLALLALSGLNLQKVQAAIEIDKQSLKDMLAGRSAAGIGIDLGMTVYGTPPLFTARPMAEHFKYGQPFVSPKGESFTLHKSWSSTVALADRPFSLLSELSGLKRVGLSYGVIDLRHIKITRNEIDEIGRELAGRVSRKKLSTFNYLGDLH